MQFHSIRAFLKQVLKLFCFSLQWEEAILCMKKQLQKWPFAQSCLGCECHATTLHNKCPNHVALWIHPNVLVFSETWFFFIIWRLNILLFSSPSLFCHHVTFRIDWVCNPTWGCQAVCISKLDGLPETAHPEASPSSTPYFPWTSWLTFPYLLALYFPGLTQRAFPPPSASFAPCPFMNP